MCCWLGLHECDLAEHLFSGSVLSCGHDHCGDVCFGLRVPHALHSNRLQCWSILPLWLHHCHDVCLGLRLLHTLSALDVYSGSVLSCWLYHRPDVCHGLCVPHAIYANELQCRSVLSRWHHRRHRMSRYLLLPDALHASALSRGLHVCSRCERADRVCCRHLLCCGRVQRRNLHDWILLSCGCDRLCPLCCWLLLSHPFLTHRLFRQPILPCWLHCLTYVRAWLLCQQQLCDSLHHMRRWHICDGVGVHILHHLSGWSILDHHG